MQLIRPMLLVCFVPLIALCQSSATPPASDKAAVEKPKKSSLSGTAVNAKTGEPVKKAKLMLISKSGTIVSTETDQSGVFEFKDVEPGSYNLMSERQGFVRQQYGARRNPLIGASLTVKAGQDVKGLSFSMWPQSVIAGKIVDEDGEGLNMVTVIAAKSAFLKGKRQMVPVGFGMTNDAGEYRIPNIGAGKYTVCASTRNMSMTMTAAAEKSDKPQQGYAFTCYPNTTDAATAAPVTVGPGAEVAATNIQFMKTPAVRVAGTVVGGEEGKQMILLLMPKAAGVLGASMGKIAMAQNGKFAISGVTPGTYVLAAVTGQELNSRQNLEVGQESLDDVVLTIGGPDVHGKLIAEGDTPAPKLSGIKVYLSAVELALSNPNATTADDATFTIKSVSPDRYQVNVGELPAGYYLKSIKLGGRELPENIVDVTAGSTPSIEVVISPKGAGVDGVVADKNGKPLSAITVALIPKSRAEYLFKNATSDQSGRFEFKNVVPGDYQLLAWEDIEMGAFQDPEVLKQFEARASKVELKEGAHQTLQLTAIPAETAADEVQAKDASAGTK